MSTNGLGHSDSNPAPTPTLYGDQRGPRGKQTQPGESTAVRRFPDGGASNRVPGEVPGSDEPDTGNEPPCGAFDRPRTSEKVLEARQPVDYRAEREQCLEWLLTFGKDLDHVSGYAYQTVKNRAGRAGQLYRWGWEYEDRSTASITTAHADA